jgi:hypothetical protein
VYIPVDAHPGQDQISLFAMVGYTADFTGLIRPANYSWSIRLEQIDCTRENPLQGIKMSFFLHS